MTALPERNGAGRITTVVALTGVNMAVMPLILRLAGMREAHATASMSMVPSTSVGDRADHGVAPNEGSSPLDLP